MKTHSPTSSEVTRTWHYYNAEGQVLGRLCTQIAKDLMGKEKTDFIRHMDMGDHVVVVNAAKVVLTGRKDRQKIYHRHSGFPGGMHVTPVATVRATKPEEIILHAVSGMLPKNKLHDRWLSHLHVYPTDTHPYTRQFPAEKAHV